MGTQRLVPLWFLHLIPVWKISMTKRAAYSIEILTALSSTMQMIEHVSYAKTDCMPKPCVEGRESRANIPSSQVAEFSSTVNQNKCVLAASLCYRIKEIQTLKVFVFVTFSPKVQSLILFLSPPRKPPTYLPTTEKNAETHYRGSALEIYIKNSLISAPCIQ